jgi:hypothetical protein
LIAITDSCALYRRRHFVIESLLRRHRVLGAVVTQL